MKVLVACEYSGTVRDAFIERGHDAMSCDLLPSEAPGPHYQGDVRDILYRHHVSKEEQWDLVIAFPPCTHLAVSGAAHFAAKRADGRQQAAVEFFKLFVGCAPRWCIENPVGIMSTVYRKPDQIIQPWQYGHATTKATCLWIGGLPLLRPTSIVDRGPRQYYASGKSSPLWHAKTGGGSGHKRSATYSGIALAMAEQWGAFIMGGGQ